MPNRHVWRASADGGWVSVGPSFLRRTGLELEACLGSGWMSVVHGGDRDSLREGLRRDGAALGAEARLWSAPQNRYVPSLFVAEAVLEPGGRVREWVGSISDVVPDPHVEGALPAFHERMLDVLSTVRALVRRSAETAGGVDELAMHVDGRITALARIQSALLRRPAQGVPLLDLAMDELRSFAGHGEERLALSGPDVRVRGKLAELVALALHELATNAVKFGALRASEGRVELDWSLRRDESLVLVWREHGTASGSAPEREGFGFDLLARTLPDDFDARAHAEWLPTGAVWTIEIPLRGPARFCLSM
ncbi:HWE histidine kinase domain-containing protein [Aureimonas sp. ME7]|uniref:HWE histidine kinase domain-containing protein n=1 Tax=Aureimonas sp. ME7 TaxID=2744252 RepID=UPI0015F60630|nr:HWE histidine kinase domain-containing protein [Aureimonas sp. ME7]